MPERRVKKMSAVLERTKRLYQKTMWVELAVLVSAFLLYGIFADFSAAVSFLLGGMASFLPFCLFVYWVCFRKKVNHGNKMTTLYRGEGLKWLATILLIVAVLKGYPNLNVFAFFCGYFLCLVCNGLLPMILRQQIQ